MPQCSPFVSFYYSQGCGVDITRRHTGEASIKTAENDTMAFAIMELTYLPGGMESSEWIVHWVKSKLAITTELAIVLFSLRSVR
jgi:hypothetical protein